MKQPLSSRHLVRSWQRHEKATIDHLVRALAAPKPSDGTMHSAFTQQGLAIEDQIRKSWPPGPFGLATF